MTGDTERWIIVPNWFGQEDRHEGLQHYKNRDPKWIKNYRRLLSKDEYRDLSGHCRGILHGLWLEYASTDGRLRGDSSSISSRLGLRVTKVHLESLNRAGFIHFSASKPLALSEQNASLEVETEREVEKSSSTNSERFALLEARPPVSEPETAREINGTANPIHISEIIAHSLGGEP